MHGQLGAPEAAHAGLVEVDVGRGDVLLQRVVDVRVPGVAEQAALAGREPGAEPDVPAVALLVREGLVEAARDGGRHGAQVGVVDAPVQPADLDAFSSAFLDDADEGLDGFDAFAVVVEGGVDEVVLHVDHDEQGFVRVDHDAAVVADTIVGVKGDFASAAAGEVEAFGFGVVEPLVVAA